MADNKTSTTRLIRYPIGNLQQGMIVDVNPLEAPVGSCVVGTSNVVWVDGFLRPRPGFMTIQALPVQERVHKLLVHQDRTSSSFLCAISLNISTGVGTFWQLTSGTWVNKGTLPAGQLDVNIPPTYGNFSGVTYFTTGGGDIWYYDPDHYLTNSAGFATLNSLQSSTTFQAPTKAKYLVAADARLVVANYTWYDVLTPYGVAWSDFSDLYTWGGAIANQGGDSGETALPKNSDIVSGLYVNSSVLTVFRPREIYIGAEVGSPAVYLVRCFDQGPGCVAHATIQPYRDGAIVWLGDDNVYIGAPGQTPSPIGDHIRLRIRQVAKVGLLDQSKALLDYDHQLYTLFFPDVNSGLCTRMFTCNLRTGGWFEGSIADPTMSVTDAIAYRISPWQTLNVVGTPDGRVLQYSLGYDQDDQTAFTCNWVSSVLPVRNFFGLTTEQASVQSLRVIGTLSSPSPVEQVTLSVWHGNGIDHMAHSVFTPDQVLDGNPDSYLFGYGRITAENFQIQVSGTASAFPSIAMVELGAIGQGATR